MENKGSRQPPLLAVLFLICRDTEHTILPSLSLPVYSINIKKRCPPFGEHLFRFRGWKNLTTWASLRLASCRCASCGRCSATCDSVRGSLGLSRGRSASRRSLRGPLSLAG